MHSLETIARTNAEAIKANIPNEQRKGKFVLAQFAGLHFIGYSTHATAKEADERSKEIQREDPSARFSVFGPLKDLKSDDQIVAEASAKTA